MDINYNTINGLIIFIVILLFIPFIQYNYNNIIGYIITILLFSSILGFFVVKKWINLFVCLYLFLLFIFYWISSIYGDNYSIQSLIDHFDFKENDNLRFDLLFTTNADNEQCKIKGEYKQIFRDDEDDSKNFENINFEDKGDLCDKIKDKNNNFIYGLNSDSITDIDINPETTNESYNFIEDNKTIISIIFILFIILLLVYLFYSKSENTSNPIKNIVQASDIKIDSIKSNLNINKSDSGSSSNIPEKNVPAQNVPAQNVPAQNVPAQNVPAES